MRFPIDIIMLDRNDIIIDIRRNVRPWRAVLCSRGTVKLIETNVDEVNAIVGTPLHVNASKY